MLSVTILNWEKYNPRKDVIRSSWFRLENDLLEHPDFFSFSNGEMLSLIYLFSQASKRNTGSLSINFEHAQVVCRIKEKDLRSAIDKLLELKVISVHDTSAYADVTPTVRARPDPAATNERTNDTNERNEHAQLKPSDREFEEAYAEYPRKEGKSRGMAKLKAQIKTTASLKDFKAAVGRYLEHTRQHAVEPKFIKHFSTFVTEWKDWLDPMTGNVIKIQKALPASQPRYIERTDDEADERSPERLKQLLSQIGAGNAMDAVLKASR